MVPCCPQPEGKASSKGAVDDCTAPRIFWLEVLGQISAVHEALRGVGKLVMHNYLENCVTHALRSGSKKKAEETYGELMDVVYKFAK